MAFIDNDIHPTNFTQYCFVLYNILIRCEKNLEINMFDVLLLKSFTNTRSSLVNAFSYRWSPFLKFHCPISQSANKKNKIHKISKKKHRTRLNRYILFYLR